MVGCVALSNAPQGSNWRRCVGKRDAPYGFYPESCTSIAAVSEDHKGSSYLPQLPIEIIPCEGSCEKIEIDSFRKEACAGSARSTGGTRAPRALSAVDSGRDGSEHCRIRFLRCSNSSRKASGWVSTRKNPRRRYTTGAVAQPLPLRNRCRYATAVANEPSS